MTCKECGKEKNKNGEQTWISDMGLCSVCNRRLLMSNIQAWKNKKAHCQWCGELLSRKKRDVSQGYYGACLTCDEDFYRFECLFKKVDK